MTHSQTSTRAGIAYAALWGLLIALYLIAPLQHLDAYAWDYDEGPYLQAAALAARGYPLYAEVVLNKLPYLTWLLQAAFALGGPTLTVARLTVLSLTLLGFVSLGLLAELWWGKGAGPATMAVYLLLPEAIVRAAVVMNDLPAMSLVLAAMVAVTRYRQRARRRWLFAGALAFALAVGLHPLLLFTGVPVLWICLAPQRHRPPAARKAARVLAVFGIAGIVVLGTALLLVDLPGFTRWVYAYNTTAAQNAGQTPGWPPVAAYLGAQWRLLVLAACSLALLVPARRRLGLSTSLAWAFMTLVALTLYRPLWQHYLIFTLYPLVTVAGGGLAASVTWPARSEGAASRHTTLRRITGIANLCLVAFLAYQHVHVPPQWPRWPAGYAAAGAYLAQAIGPEDFIATDNQFVAFALGHPVPPTLADTSFKRIRSGYLHIGNVVGAVYARNARFLVLDFDAGRFYHFPEFMRGIEAITDPPECFDALCVYRVRPYRPDASVLDAAIRLAGYTLTEETPPRTGAPVTVTLYWESLAPVAGDVTVFVHLLDEGGHLVAQHDGPPLFGLAPTTTWEAGMLVPDPHPLALPAGIAPGTYTVAVGMYRHPSLARLPATDAHGTRWQHDAIVLTTLDVEEP